MALLPTVERHIYDVGDDRSMTFSYFTKPKKQEVLLQPRLWHFQGWNIVYDSSVKKTNSENQHDPCHCNCRCHGCRSSGLALRHFLVLPALLLHILGNSLVLGVLAAFLRSAPSPLFGVVLTTFEMVGHAVTNFGDRVSFLGLEGPSSRPNSALGTYRHSLPQICIQAPRSTSSYDTVILRNTKT
jgi:hypothetical protein